MLSRRAIWGYAARRRAGKRRRLLLAACLITLLGWGFGFVWFTGTLKQLQAPDEANTDAIVVLTGGSLRLKAGLALLAANMAPKLFVSGVHTGVGVKQLLRLSRNQPEALDCCIVLGYAANDTRGNALETAAWMKAEERHSLRLVTANYHMPRSLLEFQNALPLVAITLHPVHPPHVPLDHWWRKPATGLLLFEEYNKYLLTHVRIFVSPIHKLLHIFEKP